MARILVWLDPSAPPWRGPLGRRLRAVLERVLLAVAGLLAVLLRARRTPVGLALVYHRLGPRAGDPAHELLPAIALADFERQLGLLARRYRLVPASELLPAAAGRRRGQRVPLAITFDDDEASHLGLAAPALRRHAAPATFFLCGGGRAYWWQRLQRVHDAGRLAATALPADLHAAAAVIEALPPERRDALDAELAALLAADDPAEPPLRADDVRELAAIGFEIGFHTLRHHPLDTLDDAGLDRALSEGRDSLTELAGAPLRTTAYPNGRTDARTRTAAARAGFTTGFTTAGLAVGPGSDPLLLGRLEPRSPSLALFALRLVRAQARTG